VSVYIPKQLEVREELTLHHVDVVVHEERQHTFAALHLDFLRGYCQQVLVTNRGRTCSPPRWHKRTSKKSLRSSFIALHFAVGTRRVAGSAGALA
jgi:hypothetical protein